MAEQPKLLIVDDDPGMRNQLKWGFDGYDVVTAEDRTHALEQFKKHHPPVVTLDLGLPPDAEGTDEGFATLKAIMKAAPNTKVVIVSGSLVTSNEQRAISSGAFGYFSKPVDIAKLNQIIERAYEAYKTAG